MVPFAGVAVLVTLYGAYRTARNYDRYAPTVGWLTMTVGMLLVLSSFLVSVPPPHAFALVALGAIVMIAGGMGTLYTVPAVDEQTQQEVVEE